MTAIAEDVESENVSRGTVWPEGGGGRGGGGRLRSCGKVAGARRTVDVYGSASGGRQEGGGLRRRRRQLDYVA